MLEKTVLLGDIQTDEIESLKFQLALKDAEIERQRALIERAKPFVMDWNYNEDTGKIHSASKQWLKDAGDPGDHNYDELCQCAEEDKKVCDVCEASGEDISPEFNKVFADNFNELLATDDKSDAKQMGVGDV